MGKCTRMFFSYSGAAGIDGAEEIGSRGRGTEVEMASVVLALLGWGGLRFQQRRAVRGVPAGAP